MGLKTDNITRGGQLALLRFRMFMQINNVILFYAFLAFLLLSAGLVYWRVDGYVFYNGVAYWWAHSLITISPIMKNPPKFEIIYHGKEYIFTWKQVLTDPFTVWCGLKLKAQLLSTVGWSGGLVAAGWLASFLVLGRIGKNQSEDEIVSGRTLEPWRKVARKLRLNGEASNLKAGKLPLKKDGEIQNFSMHGTVGTGKSTLIREILLHLKATGKPAIIYDKGANFIEEFYDPERGDIILNPLDERCPFWDMWEECPNLPELETLAESMIPMGNVADPFWQGSARTIYAEGAERMRADPDKTYTKFLQTLLSVGLDKLRDHLQGTPAASLVDGSIEKTAISIRSVLANYVKSMRYLQGTDDPGKPRFTIRQWMQDNDKKPRPAWLFITSHERYHESLKPLISMWLSTAATNLLSLPPDRQRRIWFVYDEIPSLHKLVSLPRVLAEGRKYGGCFMLGFQNFAQIEEAYGRDFARAMFDLLNTKFFFRSPSADVAKHVAEDLGEVVKKKFSEQTSFGSDEVRDGISYGKNETRELIVSYSDIQKLNDLECYVTLPGDYPVTKIKLRFKKLPKIAEAMIERDYTVAFDAQVEAQIAEVEVEHRHQFTTLFSDILPAQTPAAPVANQKTAEPSQNAPAESQTKPEREASEPVAQESTPAAQEPIKTPKGDADAPEENKTPQKGAQSATDTTPEKEKKRAGRPKGTGAGAKRKTKTKDPNITTLPTGEQVNTETGEIIPPAVTATTSDKPDDTETAADASASAGGRQQQLTQQDAEIIFSDDPEQAADAYADYEAYEDYTREQLQREERQFIPHHHDEQEL